eukprot:9764754-Alexandrium_andersonii.AAC.1
MSASLVGSEMCIRDSLALERPTAVKRFKCSTMSFFLLAGLQGVAAPRSCLLYTSDAADDM